MSSSPAVPPREVAPYAFTQRLSLSFMGAFAGIGIMLPYFPVWLKSLELEDREIGVLLALPMFLRIVTTPLIAAFADKARDRVDVLTVTAVLTLISTAGFFLANSFWQLLAIVLIQAVVAAPHVVLIDAITITGVRRYAIDYAKVRLWGSLAFVVSSIVGGALIARAGGYIVLPLLICGYAVMVAASIVTPRVGRPRRPSPLSEIDIEAASSAIRRPDFLLMLTGGTLIHASHAMLYGFSAIYWSSLGISGTVIGLLWALSVVGEVVLFQFASRLLGHIAISRIVIAGGIMAVVRWAVFPLDFGIFWYFALQSLHAGTFAAVHLAQQRLIVARVSEDKEASTQGLLFFLNGITMAIFTLLSGYLFDAFGARAFIAMSLVALGGVLCHYAGLRLSR